MKISEYVPTDALKNLPTAQFVKVLDETQAYKDSVIVPYTSMYDYVTLAERKIFKRYFYEIGNIPMLDVFNLRSLRGWQFYGVDICKLAGSPLGFTMLIEKLFLGTVDDNTLTYGIPFIRFGDFSNRSKLPTTWNSSSEVPNPIITALGDGNISATIEFHSPYFTVANKTNGVKDAVEAFIREVFPRFIAGYQAGQNTCTILCHDTASGTFLSITI